MITALSRDRLTATALGGSAIGFLLAALIAFLIPPLACRADLPRERWRAHDFSMLAGCWHRLTAMEVRNTATGVSTAVSEWKFCFGADGHGEQHIIYASGRSCTAEVAASFQSDDLLELDTGSCVGDGESVSPLTFLCRWRNGHVADCPEYLIGGKKLDVWSAGFHPGLFQR